MLEVVGNNYLLDGIFGLVILGIIISLLAHLLDDLTNEKKDKP